MCPPPTRHWPMTLQKASTEFLHIEQLAALYARAQYGAFATLVLIGIVIGLVWGRVDTAVLIVWGVASAALEGARLVAAHRFRRRRRTPEEQSRWFWAALVPAAASGLAWALLAAYLAFAGKDWTLMMVFALPVALMALAAVSYALHRAVHAAHVVIAAAPSVVILLAEADTDIKLAGVALAGLAVMSLYSGQLTAQRVSENLALRHASAELEARLRVIQDHIGTGPGVERLIRFQTSHDPLTGLINRREFEKRLGSAVGSAAGGRRHAICYLDLDHLDMVNDTCGHRAGDAVLRQVAARLQTLVRGTDVLARMGGDQFAALLTDCSLENATTVAENLREAVRNLRFPWEDHVFEVSTSVGLASIDATTPHFSDALSAAHAACLVARGDGGDRVRSYQPSDLAHGHHHHLVRWMQKVREAVESSRFQLLVQDIVPLADGASGERHGELLVRMLDEHGGLVAPHTFLSAAERYNLMPSVDRWVIQNAFSALGNGSDALSSLDICAINLSGQSLSDPEFLDYVTPLLNSAAFPVRRLCFEITETAVVENFDAARSFIGALKRRGCRFALDDFGSGMSSYSYLKHLPVDYLKIDGSFVRGVLEDPVDRAVVESINQIAHDLAMKTIAEYVETDEILTALRKMGVDYAQGAAIREPRAVN